MKLEQAARQALEALEACVEKFYAMKSTGVIGALPIQVVKAAQTITALREALADPQITTPDVCGEVCARAKLCYGCNKDLEEANAKYVEQAEQEPVKSAPFSNCKYQFCDLPGQCIGEGKCHHPNKLTAAPVEPVKQEHSGEANEMVREPVAILKSSKANFERQFGKQVFADWIYYDLTYSFENAAPVQQAEQEPVAWMCSDQRLIDMGYLKFSSVCQGVWNIPLYTRPVRTKYLTDDEIGSLVDAWIYSPDGYEELARAVIAADREKNK